MQNQTVLFVDDEPNMLNTIKRFFRREPYQIVTAPSAQAALNLIKAGEEPAVIISDQCMPGMTGVEFLTQAQKLLPDSIRMMLTGYADLSTAAGAINDAGIMRYLQKPWREPELLQAVREGVERYNLLVCNKALTAELQEKNTKLEDLNNNLEQKVLERTQQLESAYNKNLNLTEELKRKVVELQGRDRLQQHLLTIHPLADTVKVLLEVIIEMPSISTCQFYLVRNDELELEGKMSGLSQANKTDSQSIHKAALRQVKNSKRSVGVSTNEVENITPFGSSDLKF